jgi:PHD/YefM family antitoxin component YafN of YafNO toxin-antitoxin module
MSQTMIDLHPRILEFEGKKAFVVLTYEEFMEIEEQLQELEDIKALRKAKALEADAATVSLSELRASYGSEDAEE